LWQELFNRAPFLKLRIEPDEQILPMLDLQAAPDVTAGDQPIRWLFKPPLKSHPRCWAAFRTCLQRYHTLVAFYQPQEYDDKVLPLAPTETRTE
jgi:hypothetical protein